MFLGDEKVWGGGGGGAKGKYYINLFGAVLRLLGVITTSMRRQEHTKMKKVEYKETKARRFRGCHVT